jgi:uncharacterized RDD family membrane protein YckC
MVSVKLDTGYNIEVEFEAAPFSRRLLAWIIDILMCWLITKAMAAAFSIESFFVWTDTWDVKGLLVSLPVLFYHLFCEITLNGRSVGKIAMQCRVITEEGGQPSIGQFLIRWVFRIIDFPYWVLFAAVMGVLPWWTGPIIFSGVACVLLSPKSQRLGDIVAGTILISTKRGTSWQDTVFTELSSDYKPKYPQVMQLSDRDINTLKNIIQTVRSKHDHALARRIAERIQSKVNISSDQYPLDFLETLLLDYNYYSTR